ncbi:MAG: NAD(P)-dependent oxidoreductase [Planctomycetota bacterium]
MRVLVTGHRGYIGVHLVQILKEAGHHVTGVDVDLFEGCAWRPYTPADVELAKDIRDLTEQDLDGIDAVCHLAAISNDPMGDMDPEITYSINREGSVGLAKLAKRAGVGRYLFSGSCSVYGKGDNPELALSETDQLNPLTAYAISKIDTELQTADLADDGFCVSWLRNSTAYGHSPMLRIDLVVNNLLGSALSYGEIRIKSDGSPWRPLIHCYDIASAFRAFCEADAKVINGQAINVGGNDENYQVKDVGDQVERLIPSAKVVYTGEHGEDSRDYKVNFEKLNTLLPDFKLKYNLVSGMEELHKEMVDHGFGAEHFESDQFVRLRTLKDRFDRIGVTTGA